VVNSTSIAKLGNLEKRRLPVPSPVQTRHPPCQSLLILAPGGVRGPHILPLNLLAVLADFELAFDAVDGDAEAYYSRQH